MKSSPPDTQPKQDAGHKKVILLIDSNKNTRDIYRDMLERHYPNYRIVPAATTADGLAAYVGEEAREKSSVALVISDVQLNNNIDEGIDLCRNIRKLERAAQTGTHNKKRVHVPFILHVEWQYQPNPENHPKKMVRTLDHKLHHADGAARNARMIDKDDPKVLRNTIDECLSKQKAIKYR